MFCLGLILYEMLLPPMKTASEKTQIFSNARVGKLDAAVKGTIYEKLILHCLEVLSWSCLNGSTTRTSGRRWTK